MRTSKIPFVFAGRCLFIGACFAFPVAATAAEPQVQYFPHFADGGGYTTTWYLTGYGSEQTSVDVAVFDQSGFPQSLATDQGTGSTFHLSLNGYGSTSLRTLGASGSVKTGWVRITSSPTVGATETFRYSGSGGLLSQAAVLPADWVGSATVFVPDARSTAIALLNISSSNKLSFRLLDKNGSPVGLSSGITLNSYAQAALYVNQIPGFENVTTLGGTMEVTGSSPFYLTTLQFEGQTYTTTPVLPGRSQPASSRGSLINQFNKLIQQSKDLGDQLLAPAPEDLAAFAAFLSQPQTGLIRLLPRETYEDYLNIRGGGAYYSFARLTHEYGYGSDIELELGYLSVGFAGADFGFLTNLGDVPIDTVTTSTPAVQYLASFTTPTNEPDARIQQQRAGTGFTVGSYSYIDRMKATQSTSYAVRSVCYRDSDVLVAFRVVRFDADGSAILVWKVLQTFPVPPLN
jgi:hypothetical protein